MAPPTARPCSRPVGSLSVNRLPWSIWRFEAHSLGDLNGNIRTLSAESGPKNARCPPLPSPRVSRSRGHPLVDRCDLWATIRLPRCRSACSQTTCFRAGGPVDSQRQWAALQPNETITTDRCGHTTMRSRRRAGHGTEKRRERAADSRKPLWSLRKPGFRECSWAVLRGRARGWTRPGPRYCPKSSWFGQYPVPYPGCVLPAGVVSGGRILDSAGDPEQGNRLSEVCSDRFANDAVLGSNGCGSKILKWVMKQSPWYCGARPIVPVTIEIFANRGSIFVGIS